MQNRNESAFFNFSIDEIFSKEPEFAKKIMTMIHLNDDFLLKSKSFMVEYVINLLI